jgi:hypothetical protein
MAKIQFPYTSYGSKFYLKILVSQNYFYLVTNALFNTNPISPILLKNEHMFYNNLQRI